MMVHHDSPSPRRLLKTSEAAEWLGLRPQSLEKLRIRGGGPPFVRLSGGAIRYQVEAIEKFISERVRTSTSDRALDRGEASR